MANVRSFCYIHIRSELDTSFQRKLNFWLSNVHPRGGYNKAYSPLEINTFISSVLRALGQNMEDSDSKVTNIT